MNTRTLLSTDELAEILGKPPRTLAQWRYRQIGPSFIRLAGGSVRYALEDVDAWLDNQRVTTNEEQ